MDNSDEIRRTIASGVIPSKRECYLLYKAGFFGNRPLCWNSHQEIIDSGWQGKVCIRSTAGTARANVRYDIPLENLREEIEKLQAQGVKEEELTFNQSMPNEHIALQGEVMRSPSGLYLLYTKVQVPMNEALRKKSEHAFGLTTLMLLRQNLSPPSLDDVDAILEIFPESVIEFSAYDVCVGSLARTGRNTIIWEVRNY